jgi:glucokinase
MNANNFILAGDIGGTKTTLAVFAPDTGLHQPVAEKTFTSADYAGLEHLVQAFLHQMDLTVAAACFGVAGPVVKGCARLTNLPWLVDSALLREQLQIDRVHLLNDLEAIAGAIPVLEQSDLHTLNAGNPASHGTIAVIAPGTGLGEGFLVWDGTRYRAYPSEGGHASFGPTSADQIDLLRYLLERFAHVSYERICSGMGLPNIYAYWRDRGDNAELPEIAAQLAEADDPTPVIVNAALHAEPPSPLCRRTLDTFLEILGSEAGNLALKVLATSGVYLGGGIPPRILKALEEGPFLDAFCNKGRFRDMLVQVPVHVILNPQVALLGAAYTGMIAMSEEYNP